jgi:hypothetical protein
MGIQISQLDDMPIIILEAASPVNIPDDGKFILETLDEFRTTVEGHLIQIFDITAVDLLVSDMMITMAAESVYPYDDMEITTIFVGDYAAIAFGKDYMPTETYLFTSLRDAIDFAADLVYCYENGI